jgi:trigger factor
LNIQTELTDQHTAHLTVDIDDAMLDSAKRKAALKLSRQINVPGFRRGKAPYHVMVRMVGEGAILEEAVEMLSGDIYKDVLVESGVRPYGPGEVIDVRMDERLRITFSVPLVPEIALNDYRSVRLDYAPPSVEDEAVDRVLASLQERNAVVEPSAQPAVLGDRVTIDINAVLPNMASEDQDSSESESEHAHPEDDPDHADAAEADGPDLHELGREMKGEAFIHEHNMPITLDAEHEPIPGLAQQLVGAVSGDVRRFTLTIPEDSEDFDDIAGQPVDCLVVVRKVEKQTLPALNDDFAARLSSDQEQPLTLLELRMKVRSDLEAQAKARYDEEYASQALDQMVAQASVKYPPVMLEEEIDRILERFDSELQQNGLSLDAYLTIYKRTREQLREEYRDVARRNLERSLVMGEILVAERLRVDQSDIDARLDEMVNRFNQYDPEVVRSIFRQPAMMDSLINDILTSQVRERIAAIARGEAPEIPADADDAALDSAMSGEGEPGAENAEALSVSVSTTGAQSDDPDDENTTEQNKGESAS